MIIMSELVLSVVLTGLSDIFNRVEEFIRALKVRGSGAYSKLSGKVNKLKFSFESDHGKWILRVLLGVKLKVDRNSRVFLEMELKIIDLYPEFVSRTWVLESKFWVWSLLTVEKW